MTNKKSLHIIIESNERENIEKLLDQLHKSELFALTPRKLLVQRGILDSI